MTGKTLAMVLMASALVVGFGAVSQRSHWRADLIMSVERTAAGSELITLYSVRQNGSWVEQKSERGYTCDNTVSEKHCFWEMVPITKLYNDGSIVEGHVTVVLDKLGAFQDPDAYHRITGQAGREEIHIDAWPYPNGSAEYRVKLVLSQ